MPHQVALRVAVLLYSIILCFLPDLLYECTCTCQINNFRVRVRIYPPSVCTDFLAILRTHGVASIGPTEKTATIWEIQHLISSEDDQHT